MQPLNHSVAACRYCQYYKPMGRRGGSCEMLNVAVQGVWKGCHLSTPIFARSWKGYTNSKPDGVLVHKI